MKKVIFLSLILIFFGAFAFARIGDFFSPKKLFGFLKIESIPQSVSVFIDDKEVGVTPLQGIDVGAGIRKIKLVGSGVGWEGKVEVSADTETFIERVLGPSASFSGGLVVSYQKTKNGNSSPSLAITAKPAGVKVLIDSKEYVTPAVFTNISEGEHQLKVNLDGYLEQEFKIKVKKGFLLNCDLEMIVEPFGSKEIIVKEERIITEENKVGMEGEVVNTEIVSRTEWGGQILDIESKDLKFALWQKIEVYPIIFPNLNSITEVVKAMDFYAREFLGLYGFPFAYLITEEGEIYQGLGIRNFDFSQIGKQENYKLQTTNYQPSSGVCPVAYLSTSTAELTESAQNTLSNLQIYLAGPPRQSAKIITALEEITISPGETREVTLEFQNTGEAAWANTGDKRIFLITAPLKSASEFYTKDSWIAIDTICLPQEEKILPGQTGKFIFSLTAPFYPAKVDKGFGLFIEGTEKIVIGSEISLPISIWAEGLVAVEIMETPTGFLNVRDGPSTYAKLLGAVYPNEKYLYLDEEAGFYKIKLRDGSEGWVYAKYAEKKT